MAAPTVFKVASLISLLAAGCSVAPPATYPTQPGGADHFAILGDTRRPHPLTFWKPKNLWERSRLARAVAASRPAFVLMSGDFVAKGSSARQWADFDRDFAALKRAHLALLPALGNHEYAGKVGVGLHHYFARFPSLGGRRFYRRDWRGVRLIVLDSNRPHLPTAVWNRQARWFRDELRQADADPQVRAVVVMVHHAPVTNCTQHGDNRAVGQTLMPAFLGAHKTVALVAGHVHTYERFIRRGKTVLNSGGGGAPRHPVLTGARRRHTDDQYQGPAKRPFHYVNVRLTPRGLAGITRGFQRGEKRLRVVDRFLWTWPPAAKR